VGVVPPPGVIAAAGLSKMWNTFTALGMTTFEVGKEGWSWGECGLRSWIPEYGLLCDGIYARNRMNAFLIASLITSQVSKLFCSYTCPEKLDERCSLA
jgi:hypothetical protein